MSKPKGGQIEWYGEDLMALVENATQETLTKLALHVEGLAKTNVISKNLVDTGFMLNSIYTISEDGHQTYSEARSKAGSRRSRATTRIFHDVLKVDGEGGPWSAVAVGARYGVYQERKHSFLQSAMDQGMGDLAWIMESEMGAAGL